MSARAARDASLIFRGQRGRHVLSEPLEMLVDEPPDLLVGGVARPEIGRLSAGHARHALERRHAECLVPLHEQLRPARAGRRRADRARRAARESRETFRCACFTSWTMSMTSLSTSLSAVGGIVGSGLAMVSLSERTRGTRGRSAPPLILRRRLPRLAWSSRRGRRRRRRARGGSSRTEAVAGPTRPIARRGAPRSSDRSVSTKPCSSRAAHPDNHSEAGSAPMNENSAGARAAWRRRPCRLTRTELSVSSPSRPVILRVGFARRCAGAPRCGRRGSATCSRSGRVRG